MNKIQKRFRVKLLVVLGIALMIGYITSVFDLLIESLLWNVFNAGILFALFYLAIKSFPEVKQLGSS